MSLFVWLDLSGNCNEWYHSESPKKTIQFKQEVFFFFFFKFYFRQYKEHGKLHETLSSLNRKTWMASVKCVIV